MASDFLIGCGALGALTIFGPYVARWIEAAMGKAKPVTDDAKARTEFRTQVRAAHDATAKSLDAIAGLVIGVKDKQAARHEQWGADADAAGDQRDRIEALLGEIKMLIVRLDERERSHP